MNVKLVIIQLLGTREKLDTLEKIKRKMELCQNYIEVYSKVCGGGYAKWRGRILEHLSGCTIKLNQMMLEKVLVLEDFKQII
jgi:hypothetical protein